jgi:hypothetical protein
VSDVAHEGVAYVEFEHTVMVETPPITGRWAPNPDDPWRVIPGPGWDVPNEAIGWGRRRAPDVTLRVDTCVFAWRYRRVGERAIRLRAPAAAAYRFYAAGENPGAGKDAERWPGASDSRDDEVEPGYGGVVFLVSSTEGCSVVPLGTCRARWEGIRGGMTVPLGSAGPGLRFDEAIAWARERAPIVLVSHGVPDAQYWSAGTVDPPELDLPRWGQTEPATRAIGPGGSWTEEAREGRTFPVDPPGATP